MSSRCYDEYCANEGMDDLLFRFKVFLAALALAAAVAFAVYGYASVDVGSVL